MNIHEFNFKVNENVKYSFTKQNIQHKNMYKCNLFYYTHITTKEFNFDKLNWKVNIYHKYVI